MGKQRDEGVWFWTEKDLAFLRNSGVARTPWHLALSSRSLHGAADTQQGADGCSPVGAGEGRAGLVAPRIATQESLGLGAGCVTPDKSMTNQFTGLDQIPVIQPPGAELQFCLPNFHGVSSQWWSGGSRRVGMPQVAERGREQTWGLDSPTDLWIVQLQTNNGGLRWCFSY